MLRKFKPQVFSSIDYYLDKYYLLVIIETYIDACIYIYFSVSIIWYPAF